MVHANQLTWLALLTAVMISQAGSPEQAKLCSVKMCALNETTEISRWKCLGNYLFRPALELEEHIRFVVHPCEGLGWGNSIASLGIAAQLTSVLDGRLIFQRKSKLLWEIPEYQSIGRPLGVIAWNYAVEGKQFSQWVENLTESRLFLARYDNMKVDTGICAMDVSILSRGDCIAAALPTFGKCLQYVPDTLANMPIFYTIFQNPSPALVHHLQIIRLRLNLPLLPPDFEPRPGSWGLYTPGYYFLAFHVRIVPIGFEPMSAILNRGDSLARKLDSLSAFWPNARAHARRARSLAACRRETLLLYFATDAAATLRPVAEAELGEFGRVIFGLAEDEVGHSSPQWSPAHEMEVDTLLAETDATAAAAAAAAKEQMCTEAPDGAAACVSALHWAPAAHAARAARDAAAVERHAEMSLVEWWILANSQVGPTKL